MTIERRSIDRRRRVLFSSMRPDTHERDDLSPTESHRLRSARRPQDAYGSRVKRRLRSRWFSLVPIHRGSLLGFIAITFGIAFLICLGHYQAATSAFLLNHPEVARPFKIDHPSSFGQLMILSLTVCSAGAALMIYQLRRYRNDDFGGKYRVWRFAALLLALQVVNSTTDLAGWSGALIDAALGQRLLLSGADWTRLLIDITGIALATRLFLETRRNLYAASFLVAGCVLLCISEFKAWRPVEISTPGFWLIATCSSLIGLNAIFVSLVIYLRKIYRQVREIDTIETDVRTDAQISTNSDEGTSFDESLGRQNSAGSVFRFIKRLSPMSLIALMKITRAKRSHASQAPRPAAVSSEENCQQDDSTENQALSNSKTKRGWFKTKHRSDDPINHEDSPSKASRIAEEQELENPVFESITDDNEEAGHDNSEDEMLEEDDIDWGSMNKSERRRLRKQLKRQKRAA